VRDGRVLDANAKDAMVKGVQAFNDKLASDTRVEGIVTQTVGIKGYDGIAMAMVRH